jgi:hypothetical protein
MDRPFSDRSFTHRVAIIPREGLQNQDGEVGNFPSPGTGSPGIVHSNEASGTAKPQRRIDRQCRALDLCSMKQYAWWHSLYGNKL